MQEEAQKWKEMYEVENEHFREVFSQKYLPLKENYSEALEAVQTLEEQGIRGANLGAWQGIMAPKGTPAAVVNTLNGHFNEIMKLPDVQARMALATTVPTGGEPRFLGRTHAAEYERMAKVIAENGIKAD